MAVQVLVGDAREQLATLPAESVQCVVTSPPYWGLRAYKGGSGMIGLEPTFDEHLENIVAVFREVRRVLRKDGTLWLNYGDAYASSTKGSGGDTDWQSGGRAAGGTGGSKARSFMEPFTLNHGLKPKDLMMMPARVAMALQADGWWLRSEIIWHKPNPMPESVVDRPTSAHEKLFLLSKGGAPTFWTHTHLPGVRSQPEPDCYWRNNKTGCETDDEPADWRILTFRKDGKDVKLWRRINRWVGHDYFYDAEAVRQRSPETEVGRNGRQPSKGRAEPPRHEASGPWHKSLDDVERGAGAALRNVWKIPTHGYKEAHFATFPPALVEPCIKAGTSEKGACAECGAPWVRTVEMTPEYKALLKQDGAWTGNEGKPDTFTNRQESKHPSQVPQKYNTTGWSPSCECDADTVPCVCLDPFGGSGTVGLVADRLQRDALLIEISGEYANMARRRIHDDAPLLAAAE